MQDDNRLRDELNRMQAESLLPAERKLIAISITLGVALLAAMAWLARIWFPHD